MLELKKGITLLATRHIKKAIFYSYILSIEYCLIFFLIFVFDHLQ